MSSIHGAGSRVWKDGERSWPAPPWVGRQAELALLASRLDMAARGRAQVVLVEGGPGRGKSALIRHAEAEARTTAEICHLNCDASERDVPLALVARLAASLGAMSGEAARHPSPERILALLGRTRGEAPLLVAIDDLQWADLDSVQVLGHVLRRLDTERVVVVASLVTDDVGLDLESGPAPDASRVARCRRAVVAHGQAVTLRVRDFDAEEIGELAAAMGRRVTPAVAARLLEFTQGHPGYVSMILADAGSRLLEDSPLPVPAAVSARVRAHLADLPPDSRRLVEALAVVGPHAPLALVAQVGEVEDSPSALEPLLASGLVRWRPADPLSPLDIADPLYAAATYEAIRPIHRRRLHQVATDLVDTGRGLEHRVAAADGRDVDLGDDLEREAVVALAQGEPARASRYLQWATDLGTRRADRERRLLMRVVVGAPSRLVEDRELRHRIERCLPGAVRDLAMGLVRQHVVGDHRGAAALFESARNAATGPDGTDRRWVAEAAGTASAQLALSRFDGPRAVAEADRVLAAPTTHDLCAVLRATRAAVLGRLLTEGPAAALDAIERLRPSQTNTALSITRIGLVLERAICLLLAGRYAEAFDEASAVVADQGPGEADIPAAALVAAAASLFSGLWVDAAATVRQALTVVEPHERLARPLRAAAAVAAAMRGGVEDALEHLDAMTVDVRTAPESSALRIWARAGTALALGYREALRGVGEDAPPWSDPPDGAGATVARALAGCCGPVFIEAFLSADRFRDAEAVLDDLLVLGPPGRAVSVARVEGAIAERSGRVGDAVRHYLHGLAEAPSIEDIMPLRALLEKAVERLQPGVATPAAGTARGRLVAPHPVPSGAGPLRGAVWTRSGDVGQVDRWSAVRERPEQLVSEREREIAVLVTAGKTNRQVAARLYITEKTVEYHLRRIFVKLGVSSRHELRERWGEDGAG